MKILFVGVFDNDRKSTNTSQLLSFKRLGCHVIGYNYREKAKLLGNAKRDLHLLDTIKKGNLDLTVFSKCSEVSTELFEKSKKYSKTCLWFMDPLQTYDVEMKEKTKVVSYFCCDKLNVLEAALEINKKSFHVCEGYDEDVDKPFDVENKYNCSFIGNLYGKRKEMINKIKNNISIITNAYGVQHAQMVSSTKINLNFCTDYGASDRVYKIMAAGGFLLTNDWTGRNKDFNNKEHLVIFDSVQDLDEKINYYLNNDIERNNIADNGYKRVQKFNRLNWAKNILEPLNE